MVVVRETHIYPLKTRTRTGELIAEATDIRQRDARCERRQRACVKRANQVILRKQNTTVCSTGTTLLSVATQILTGELVVEAIE